jgi:polyisoprenoid-binding protein YceI
MKGSIKSALIVIAVLAIFSSRAWAGTYSIDKNHSTIGFSTTHLMVSTVWGAFGDYQGTIQFDPANPEATSAEATIQAASIDTHQPDRDKHLRSPDFLDVEKYPTITFKTKSVKKEGSNYILTGDLTLHGVTKEITLPVTINGPIKSPMNGKDVIGLNGQTKISRQDFGITWNKQMDQGGYVLSDDVTLDISVEAHQE